MRNAEKTVGNMIDKEKTIFVGSVDAEGFPNIKGLSEHTVRQLVAQGKVKYIRTGQGKRGKILVNKEDLVHLFA